MLPSGLNLQRDWLMIIRLHHTAMLF